MKNSKRCSIIYSNYERCDVMGIANHLLTNFELVKNKDELRQIKKQIPFQVYRNYDSITYEIYKKEYSLIPYYKYDVYNIRIDVKNFNINDTIQISFTNTPSFKRYDSDENTVMIDYQDNKDYYAIIGYDKEDSLINECYGIYDIRKDGIYYSIDLNPKEHLDYELAHVINVWIVHIDKSILKNVSNDSISECVFNKLA